MSLGTMHVTNKPVNYPVTTNLSYNTLYTNKFVKLAVNA